MIKTKCVATDELWRLFHLESFTQPQFYSKFSYFGIQFFNCSNKVGSRYDQNKSSTPRSVLPFYYWWLFHPKSFYPKILFEALIFKIQILICSNKFGWINDQNKSCTSQWVIQLCCCQHFHLKWFTILIFFNLLYFEIQILNCSKKSAREMTKIKVVDLDEFYSFVIDDFFILNHLLPQSSIWSYRILKFKLFKQNRMENWIKLNF